MTMPPPRLIYYTRTLRCLKALQQTQGFFCIMQSQHVVARRMPSMKQSPNDEVKLVFLCRLTESVGVISVLLAKLFELCVDERTELSVS